MGIDSKRASGTRGEAGVRECVGERGFGGEWRELVFLEADCFVAENDLPSAIVCLRSGMNDVLDEDTANERLAKLYGQTGE